MDRGAWWATVHGLAKSWTRLSDQYGHGANKVMGYKAQFFFTEEFQLISRKKKENRPSASASQ